MSNEKYFHGQHPANETKVYHLSRLAPYLTGGKIVCTDKNSALYLPPGWIHCTLTLSGGFSYFCQWASVEDLPALVRFFNIASKYQELEYTRDLLPHLLETLKLALTSPDPAIVRDALGHWVRLMDDITLSRNGIQQWGYSIISLTKSIIKGVVDDPRIELPATCPCSASTDLSSTLQSRMHLLTHALCKHPEQKFTR